MSIVETPSQQPPQQAQITKPVQPSDSQMEEIEKTLLRQFMDHKLFFPVIIIVIILICCALIALLSPFKKASSKATEPTRTQQAIKKTAQKVQTDKNTQTFIYGTWTGQSSVIRSFEIGTTDVKTLATLPLNVKKISVLSNDSLLYIDQTDSNNLGQRISVYNITEKQIIVNIPADSGYGINDYVLSPNKRYLAIWEVKFSPDTGTLQGGQSRVYAIDLTSPTVSNLLYDEDTTETTDNGSVAIPIHYPVAILNNGRVFADQLLPNGPNGNSLAYGLSVVDFDGTNKQDIPTMTNGTYGSQPSLSPDGKFLLFAGYDGKNGDGTKMINGNRQAILTPDTVELMDTTTFKRFPLSNLPTSNTYPDVQWDKQTANVIISILSPVTKKTGVYSYDLDKLQATQIPIPNASNTQYGYIAQLNATKTLIGIQSTDPSNLGNLGNISTYAYTQLATVDNTAKLSYMSVADPFIQFITILPGNYF